MEIIRMNDQVVGQKHDNGSHIYYYNMRNEIVAVYDKAMGKTRVTSTNALDVGNTGVAYVVG